MRKIIVRSILTSFFAVVFASNALAGQDIFPLIPKPIRQSLAVSTALTSRINGGVYYCTGGITVTLPLAALKQEVKLINVGPSGAITVNRAGSDTIGGATSISIPSLYQVVTLTSDGGTTWYGGVSSVTAADLTAALASPPAIGGTTPAAGTFSPLSVGKSDGTAGSNETVYATLTSIHTFTAANWNEDGATWTFAGATLDHVAGNTTAVTATLTEAVVVGTKYTVRIVGTGGGGTCSYTFGGVTGRTIAASGAIDFTDSFVASTTGGLIITPASASTVSITNIVVTKKTTGTGDLTVQGSLLTAAIQNLSGTNVMIPLPGGNAYFPGNVGIGKLDTGTTLHIYSTAGTTLRLGSSTVTTPFTVFGVNTFGNSTWNSTDHGGFAFQGFVDATASISALLFEGYHGSASPTAASIGFRGWKTDGGTGATALTGTSPIADFIPGNGTAVVRVLANGTLLVGTIDADGTPAIGRMVVKGTTNDGTTNILVGRDSDEANVFVVDTNGQVTNSAPYIIGNSAKPSALTNQAAIYAYDSAGTTELFTCDEALTETQQTAHAADAPDWLYDADDGLPMIVKEIQYILGYVRYTNQTRQARLSSMTDVEKAALTVQQRTCVFNETFAEHQSRTGRKLVKITWSEHQVKSKEQHDKLIAAAENVKAQLQTRQTELKAKIQAEADSEKKAEYQKELDAVKERYDTTVIPGPFVPKPIPVRLQAALNK